MMLQMKIKQNIPDHSYAIIIIGAPVSRKTNVQLNFIHHQIDIIFIICIDNIYYKT